MHYLLFYDYAPDYLERRAQFRADHLALAWEYMDRGLLLLGGVLEDPVDSAVLLFQADSPQVVEAFVAQDPYVRGKLAISWRIRPWNTVVGAGSAHPVPRS